MNKGFTVIELMVVLAIFIFLTSLGLFLSTTTLRKSSFSSDVSIVASVLQRARSRAVNNINESSHGARITSSGYTIFQGTSYNPADPLNENIPSSPQLMFSPAMVEVIFSQLSGDSNLNTNIVITNGINTATISLNYEGQISW